MMYRLWEQLKLRERFDNEAMETVGSSPAELGTFVRIEITKWGKVVRAAKVQPE